MKQFPNQNSKILAQITEEQWATIYKRLRLFVYTNYGWLNSKGYDLAALIQESIEDTITGTRRWPPLDKKGKEKTVDLFFFLCQTIRSKVSHLLEQEWRKVSIEDITDESLLNAPPSHLNPHQQSSDQQAIYNELCNHLRGLAYKDDLLLVLVELYIEMPDMQPSDIAQKLGLSVEEVNKARKRLSRRVKRFGWDDA